MKFSIAFIFLATMFVSCSKNCHKKIPACKDEVPSGATCMAFFTTYLYNKKTKQCELKGYSACEPLGFQTLEECQQCDCK